MTELVAQGTEFEVAKISRGRLSFLSIVLYSMPRLVFSAPRYTTIARRFFINLSLAYRYLDPDPLLLATTRGQEANTSNPRFHALNQAIVQLVSLSFILLQRYFPPSLEWAIAETCVS